MKYLPLNGTNFDLIVLILFAGRGVGKNTKLFAGPTLEFLDVFCFNILIVNTIIGENLKKSKKLSHFVNAVNITLDIRSPQSVSHSC